MKSKNEETLIQSIISGVLLCILISVFFVLLLMATELNTPYAYKERTELLIQKDDVCQKRIMDITTCK